MWTKDPALQRTFSTAGTAALGWLHGTAHGKTGSPRRLCTMLGRFWHGRCCLCRRRHVIRDMLASAFEHFCYWQSRRKSHTGSWTPGPVSAELNARGTALSVASFPGVFVLPVLGCGGQGTAVGSSAGFLRNWGPNMIWCLPNEVFCCLLENLFNYLKGYYLEFISYEVTFSSRAT